MIQTNEKTLSEFKEFSFLPIRRILVFFDEDVSSTHCMRTAIELAKEINSSVIMLTISYSEVMGSSFLSMDVNKITAEKMKIKKLKEKFDILNSIAKQLKVTMKHDNIFSTSIAESILSYAISNSVDLIIMGIKVNSISNVQYRGLNDLKTRIFQGTQCPVLYLK